jgi:Tfp pilus assembly protein PilF
MFLHVRFGASVLLAALLCGCAGRESASVPEEVIRHNIVGAAYLGQTKWAEAEEAFRKALALRPDDALLLTNTAIAVSQQGRTDEALELLRRAVAADPAHTAAHFNLGLIESRGGDFEAAAAHFRAAAELDPGNLYVRYYLGTSLSRTGREDEAVEALRGALDLEPTHVSTLYALGRLLLQRGEEEEGTRLIMRSQEIRTRSGLDEAVGSEYGEQGIHSKAADYAADTLAAPPPIPVRFAVSSRVELGPSPAGPAWAAARLGLASDASGPHVVLAARQGSVLQLFPPGRSEPLATCGAESATIVALAAGDLDNDARADLVALLSVPGPALAATVFLQGEDGSFAEPPGGDRFGPGGGALPVEGFAGVDLALVDRDHDGDLDAFWCWTAPAGGSCSIATNHGAAAFDVRPAADHGFDPGLATAGPVAVAFSDSDNDRDVDLLVASADGVRLFSNERDGTFEDVSGTVGLGPGTGPVAALAVADLDKDGWMDLLLGAPRGPLLALRSPTGFEAPLPLVDEQPGDALRVVVLDFDNDGFLDVAAGAPDGPVVYHYRGARAWRLDRELLRVEGIGVATQPITALDLDGDGDLDLLTAEPSGTVSLAVNEGGNANRWIRLASQGVGDNKFGIGAKVEVLAGALRQKFEVARPLGVHAGLGSRERVDAVRYLWPSGVLQDELDLPAGGATLVAQLDRKGTSCPLLYAWRDGGWRFVTDFLGGCAIGYQHAPGVYSVPDTDEYVRIEGGLERDAAGRLRLRLNNQLEEVIWFDKAELVVVDHPAGTEVYPDERLMPGPPYPEFRLFASDEIRPIAAARSVEDGSDQTSALRELDRRYVDNFALLRPKGHAEMHTLELDLGAFPPDRRAVLLLDGWIDYADSSANVAAHQAGLRLVPPVLSVADGRGGWLETQGRMGFPAGLPKTMAVDLTGLHPSADRRIRIATTMRIYWDRARMMIGGEDTPLDVHRVAPATATLAFGGYLRPVRPGGRGPLAYDPADVSADHAWKAHVGEYTPFGEVTALISGIDDRFVTTKHGDQIELVFDGPPALDAGRARTYLLFADGFGKDMDPNSAAAGEVGPVPFHGMPRYPYGDDVVPPVVPATSSAAPRRVEASPDGIPGAIPLEQRLLAGR